MRSLIAICLGTCIALSAYAQRKENRDEIKVLARPSLDSVTLRWAPLNLASWLKGNRFGYQVERYTLIREKKFLSVPERKILTSSLLKPHPLADWESLVKKNKYAAIAAQALYGDSFQLTTQVTDVFQVANKVKENEQRFSFALFSADMSANVSAFMGLRFTDKNVKKDEKYLYRILCIAQPGNDTLRGSVFIAPEEYTPPVPIDFTAEFKGNVVAMKWNQSHYKGVYTAFIVERSSNGKDFKSLSDNPLVMLSGKNEESRYQYATDSLPNQKDDFYYRIRGLTPFGELGPPSDAVKGKGSVESNVSPQIINGTSENNKSIKLEWEFPTELNNGLKGFQIRRAESPKQIYKNINTQLLAVKERMYEDNNPKQTNYYQVVAISNDSKEYKSPVYYAQLVDSIPPLAPTGLAGKITGNGKIVISWSANKESDIYGYRIYRGNYKSDEFSQLTREPMPDNSFADSVNLKTLNRHLHYQIMAIDRNQNYSALSDVFTLELPDIVKPVPPVFFPTLSSREGVVLHWTPSSSDDISRYDIYRREGQLWRKIFSHVNLADSLYYIDKGTAEGQQESYTVVAIDKSGNESDPSAPVSGIKIMDMIRPPVSLREPDIDRSNKKITLKWNYNEQGVNSYKIYRAKEGQPLKLLTTISSINQRYEDNQLSINSIYIYRVMAFFGNGAKSELSKELRISY